MGLDEGDLRRVRGADVGIVFQDPMTSLNPTKRSGCRSGEALRLQRGASKSEARQAALDMLDLVGLPRPADQLERFPHELSGGMRQRVVIASALICQPKLLVADEPTTALDVTIQGQILELFDRLRNTLSMAMLLITHDMGVVAGHTDRVLVMYAGREAEVGPTADLFGHPRHRYTEALLGSVIRMESPWRTGLNSIPGRPPDLTAPLDGLSFRPSLCGRRRPVPDGTPGGGRQRSGTATSAITQAISGRHDGSRRRTRHELGGGADRAESRRARCRSPGDAGALLADTVPGDGAAGGTSGVCRGNKAFQWVTALGHGRSSGAGCGRRGPGHPAWPDDRCRGRVWLREVDSGPAPGRPRAPDQWADPRARGRDLWSLSRDERTAVRFDVQMMFQDPYASLNPRMSVLRIIEEPLRARGGMSHAERRARVTILMGEVGLSANQLDRFPHELSGGQRQRVGLARALATNAALIVADEPVSALDVSVRSQILKLMTALQDEHGLAYLMISHDLAVVRWIADHIFVMYLGKIVESGNRDDLFERPAHHYTKALIDAVPEPDPAHPRPEHASPVSCPRPPTRRRGAGSGPDARPPN